MFLSREWLDRCYAVTGKACKLAKDHIMPSSESRSYSTIFTSDDALAGRIILN